MAQQYHSAVKVGSECVCVIIVYIQYLGVIEYTLAL